MKCKTMPVVHRSKNVILSIIVVFSIINFSCGKSSAENGSEDGYAAGKIIDTKGIPLAGAEIAVENTLVGYHSVANAVSGNDGHYQVQLSHVGTFHASAYINKVFNGKQYKLELHCDNNDAFGNEGVIRNFQWKLSGPKTVALDGFYGSTVELYNEPGYYIDENNIVLTLTPVGALIDGSTGSTIVKRPVVSSYAVLNDIPLGRYNISATYNGTPLKLKKLDSNQPYNVTSSVEFEQVISSGTPIARFSYNQ